MATKKNVKAMSKKELSEKLFSEESLTTTAKKSKAKKPVENSLKVVKKTPKKTEKVEKPAEKKVAKITTAKKSAEKKTSVKKEEPNYFPAEVNIDGTDFSRVKLSSWQEFKDFVNACQEETGIHVVIACNWPATFKKDYNANNQGDKLFPKDGFKFDLDMQEVLMLQQTRETVITVSIITESVILFRDEFFELDADHDYFVYNGMPFMIYTYTENNED